MARFGRRPEELKVMPGIFPVVGRTQAEAEEKFEELQSLIQPEVGLDLLSTMIGVDLSGYPIDGPVPELPETNGGKSRQKLVLDLARREGPDHPPALSAHRRRARPLAGRRHAEPRRRRAGGAVRELRRRRLQHHVADQARRPDRLHRTGVPELRRRGLFRDEYEGRTLRENLGLARPAFRRATTAPFSPLPNDSAELV